MNNGFYEFSRGKQQVTSSVFPYTGSATISGSLQVTGSILSTQGFTGSLFGTSSWAINSLTASFVTGSNVFGPFGSNSVVSASFAVSSSRAVTSSFATTSSFAISSSQTQNSVSSSFAQTASLAPNYLPLTGGTINGSLTIQNNLTVLGSASIQYISESTLNIGTNLITVNTFTPSVRFGGLAVIDSGSSPLVSASFLYDSLQDEFIFVHKGTAASAVTSSHFVLGPETYDSVGNEIYLTANRLPKGTGNEHLNDSNISDNGSVVSINSNTQVTGSLTVTQGITGSLFGTSSRAISASFAVSGGNQNLQQVLNNGGTAIDKLVTLTNTTNNVRTVISSEGFETFNFITNAGAGGNANNLYAVSGTNSIVIDPYTVIISTLDNLTTLSPGNLSYVPASGGSTSVIFTNPTANNNLYFPDKTGTIATLDDIPNTSSFVVDSTFNSFTSSYNTGSFTGSFTGDGSGLTNLPVQSIDTSSFATTGSNIFQGTQTITGSNGRLIYKGTTPVYPYTLAEIHANDDLPWLHRFYNDTFSTSSAVMAYYGYNDGRFVFHNESTQSIGLQVNGYSAENGLLVYSDKVAFVNNVEVTGSLNVVGGITGSLLGTASWSNNTISSSFASTASFAPNYVINSSTSSFVTNSQTSSMSVATASFAQSGNGSFSGSFSGSGANLNSIPASAIVGLTTTQIATGSVTASVSPTEFTVVSGSSTELVVTGTGVTLGSALTDTHRVTGSLNITGSITATTYNNLQNSIRTFNTTQGIYYFEDFMGSLVGNINSSINSIINAFGNGQGTTRTTANITNRTNQQGVVESLTSANTTGQAGYTFGGTSLFIGNGSISIETYINITTLSNSTDRFFTFFGYMTGSNFNNPGNCAVITYDEGAQFLFANGSTFFKCVNRAGGTATTTITNVTVNAGQWYKLRIDINSNASSITYYIDGVLVATHNTNIPLSTTAMYIASGLSKSNSSGTAARAFQTDYFMYEQIFTNPR